MLCCSLDGLLVVSQPIEKFIVGVYGTIGADLDQSAKYPNLEGVKFLADMLLNRASPDERKLLYKNCPKYIISALVNNISQEASKELEKLEKENGGLTDLRNTIGVLSEIVEGCTIVGGTDVIDATTIEEYNKIIKKCQQYVYKNKKHKSL